jgi:hypothetical protein
MNNYLKSLGAFTVMPGQEGIQLFADGISGFPLSRE